jgi:hypothetical protein
MNLLLSIDSTVVNNVPSFGIFDQLANYGALGLVVLAMGAVGWMLLKRQLDDKDRMQRRLEELERGSK